MRRPLLPAENYAFLLTGLLFFLLLLPVLHMVVVSERDFELMRLCVQIGFGAMMLIGVWSLIREKRLFQFGLGLAALSVAFAVVGVFHRGSVLVVAEALVIFAFCVMSGFIAARHVFSGTRIDRNMLYGALCVYLLMGLVWAIAYTLIFEFWPNAFHGLEGPAVLVTIDDFLYFSFVTLASLGYGDITPAVPLAKTLAYLEVIAGQFYIAIMVAGLVGLYMQDRERK